MSQSSLSAAAIAGALTTRWAGRPIHYLPQVDSTNDLLHTLAEGGAPAGTLVITDLQTAGKGRLGRRWEAPHGTALLLSLLFRPPWPPEQAGQMTMIAGLAAAEAVEQQTSLRVALKWPNDLVCGSPEALRKLCGILLEARLDGPRLAYLVVGMGLNVNIPPAALPDGRTPASSLLSELGTPTDRLALLDALLSVFERRYEAAVAGASPHEAWAARMVQRDRPVTVTHTNGAILQGTAVGVTPLGHLEVRDAAGRLHVVAAGDVTLRP